jgi:aspartyl-tRNA(Asn)/glutamyl-tRNA(Gln) amidotransferase subunit A
MSSIPLNFEQWRARMQESPECGLDDILTRLQTLSKIEKQAWFAATPSKQAILDAHRDIVYDETSPLLRVPYVLQDMFDVEGMPTGCGASIKALADTSLEENSQLYQTLQRHGAYLVSKARPAEFGIDPQGRNEAYGDCPHHDGKQFVCGGGAGSVARTVKEGLVPLGFGLDTAGGIRIPAAFHGLFGFRMSNNLYASQGVFPMVPSIESVGWFNHNIADLTATFQAFHQVSPFHTTDAPLGYYISDLSENVSSEIKSGLMRLTRELAIDDNPVVGTNLIPLLKQAKAAYQTLEARELYSIHQYLIEEHSDEYDKALLARIQKGIDCTHSDAEAAEEIQAKVRQAFTEFFDKYDYLVLAISPVANPEKSDWSDWLESNILQLMAPASLAFLPALILPFSCSGGRHSAAQIIINPRKLQVIPELLAQLTGYYED